MNFLWLAAIAVADAIITDLERRIAAGVNEELVGLLLQQIQNSIRESTARVLQFMREQRLDEFAGKVDGLLVTFQRFLGDPARNEERLINLIDDLAQLIGEMNRIVAHLNTDEALALNVFSPYAEAVALSATAITERRERFGVNEPMAGILEQARDNAIRVRGVLRNRSDARFSRDVQDH